jgi:stage III sporulation protein AG
MAVQNNVKKNTDGAAFIKKNGKVLFILFCGIIGAIILFYTNDKFGGTGTSQKNNSASEHADLAEYTDRLEESIGRICSNVAGVSDVTVAVTLKSGYEYVYAAYSDNKTDGSVEIKYITIGSGSSKTPVYITEKLPEIAGIGIVCRGGSNPAIQQKLIDLISAAYNIGSNKIYITGS